MRILLVDDNESVRLTLGAVLEDAGHVVIEADSLAAARRSLPGAHVDVVLLDLQLGDGLGSSLIPELRAALPAVTIALLTGDAEPPRGADVVLVKGADPLVLLSQLERSIGNR